MLCWVVRLESEISQDEIVVVFLFWKIRRRRLPCTTDYAFTTATWNNRTRNAIDSIRIVPLCFCRALGWKTVLRLPHERWHTDCHRCVVLIPETVTGVS
jgi:hypothetical protein